MGGWVGGWVLGVCVRACVRACVQACECTSCERDSAYILVFTSVFGAMKRTTSMYFKHMMKQCT